MHQTDETGWREVHHEMLQAFDVARSLLIDLGRSPVSERGVKAEQLAEGLEQMSMAARALSQGQVNDVAAILARTKAAVSEILTSKVTRPSTIGWLPEWQKRSARCPDQNRARRRLVELLVAAGYGDARDTHALLLSKAYGDDPERALAVMDQAVSL